MRIRLRSQFSLHLVIFLAFFLQIGLHGSNAQGRPDIVWTRAGHSRGVVAVAFSPTADVLASAGADDTVKLWRPSDSTLLRTLVMTARSVVFSPDGQTLAIGSENGIQLRRISDNTLLKVLPEPLYAHTLSYSSDGSTLAAANYWFSDNRVFVWRVADGTLLHSFPGPATAIALSPNGQTLAVAVGNAVQLWRLSDESLIHTLAGYTDRVNAVAFSPDEQTLVSGSTDRWVKLWRVPDGSLRQEWQISSRSVSSVAFSPDGQLVVAGGLSFSGSSNMLYCWRLADGAQLFHQVAPQSAGSVAFSSDSRTLASSGNGLDSTILLWSIPSGQMVQDLTAYHNSIWGLDYSPDGYALAAASLYDVGYIWNSTNGTLRYPMHFLSSGKIIFTLPGPAIAYSSLLQGGSASFGFVNSYNIGSVQHLWSRPHGLHILDLAYTPHGQLVASSSYADHVIRLWNAADGTSRGELVGHLGEIESLAFSPDGKLLASGASLDFRATPQLPDYTVRLWRMSDRQMLHTLRGHTDRVTAVAFSPNGHLVASASGDGTVKLWRVADGALLHTLVGHINPVSSVAFTSDGQTLASGSTGSNAHTIRFWRVSDGALLRWFDDETGTGITSLRFSPDGQTFAYARMDATLVVARNPYPATRLENTVLKMTASNDPNRTVDGIVCDNLRSMRQDAPDLRNSLRISLTEHPGAVITSATLSPAGESSGEVVIRGDTIAYYPPDEFNEKQEPSSTEKGQITTSATRAVTLYVNFMQGDKLYTVTAKPIILARPPVVLVHGINSDWSAWRPLLDGVKKTGVRIPFATINHWETVYRGNGLVEVAAKRLQDTIRNVLHFVRTREPIPFLDFNSVDVFKDYQTYSLAIQRVDVIAWSYGGVITRWYIASNGSRESLNWYAPNRNYSYSLPEAPAYQSNIRKVITLGSMWRGTPLANYANEARFSEEPNLRPENGTNMSAAPFLIQGTLGSFMDRRLDSAVPTRVPSMEVMAIESRWMRSLLYPCPDRPDESAPFADSIAYGSVAGDDNNYPIPLPKIRIAVQPDPYSIIGKLQRPSWFPGLIDEVREGSCSDGLVPLWSSIIPDKPEGSMIDSYAIVPCDHASYPSNSQTQDYVLRFLNHAAVKTGNKLNERWRNTEELTIDSQRFWFFSPDKMAPGIQRDYYGQFGGIGRLNPAWLAIDLEPQVELVGEQLYTRRGDIYATIKVTNPSQKPGRMLALHIDRLDTHLGENIRVLPDNLPMNSLEELYLGDLKAGDSREVRLRFRPDLLNPSIRSGQKVTLCVTLEHNRKRKVFAFHDLLVP